MTSKRTLRLMLLFATIPALFEIALLVYTVLRHAPLWVFILIFAPALLTINSWFRSFKIYRELMQYHSKHEEN